jgi:pimeloyl-ACP methyl ester carboxylesterase
MAVQSAQGAYESRTVLSRDGTTIGYREVGRGPGVVLIHGGMMSAHSLLELATALSEYFTVFIPDRRGRGSSGPLGRDHGLRQEVEDLAAILQGTGAHCVFGLSSGAIVALESALQLPAIRRLALYEPPLTINGSNPAAWLPRYEAEIAAGNLPAAMVTVSKGVPVSPVFSRVPRMIGTLLMRLALPADERRASADDVPLAALIPTMRGDAQVVIDAADKLQSYQAVTARVLLLGGSRSPRSLKVATDALAAVLHHVERVEIAGVGHMAADNGGHPDRVARELLRFFTAPGADKDDDER